MVPKRCRASWDLRGNLFSNEEFFWAIFNAPIKGGCNLNWLRPSITMTGGPHGMNYCSICDTITVSLHLAAHVLE